ncbi:isoaspartyl peptidase/L-asparaginase family protein [Algoriphagus zhangzhouensis]|uniref:N4-(Beta-N-acetylglucosaminyl)-L-asparaginase n=1 Tax=Algoriphagus zhangzhouensis TaxID=1073327 RepID=A0A1M7ZJH4_9BACT|nr:N(4)-(beta-N-acetylglucosaminyl)-L-asparaginase [Algoriphagus zhangzhouensis]TDY43523.1 N4-(beta-N-acetylglucosaminyl)-L-asparaginase [Algoriphagus zhangzhouensis]SHO65065.1 N4-(beta-N-acetylglucosaminyl)-L-asparaginase [Algoriphagus zhangzhouensis]
MSQRRKFIKQTLMSSALFIPGVGQTFANGPKSQNAGEKPLILSTWNHGLPANAAALKKYAETNNILDAVEAGVMDTELDMSNLSVGLQGLPDREGITTLDASIMKGDGSCGSVAFVRQVKHPISLARVVMEKTPHVMIVGEGARQLAIAEGFPIEEEKLSPKAKAAYLKWKETSQYKPVINIENHDTIGMIGIGADGKLAGSCTTSGLAYKMHGRVGDSPIIGAGLYVDDEVGAATATGLGESIIRICGSFLIVELMRQGRTPQEACEETVRRLVAKNEKNIKDLQAGFLAINKDGEVGAFAVHPGFNFAKGGLHGNAMIDSNSYFKG